MSFIERFLLNEFHGIIFNSSAAEAQNIKTAMTLAMIREEQYGGQHEDPSDNHCQLQDLS